MEKVIINSLRRIRKTSRLTDRCFRLCGTLAGTYQSFADATLDHQWIHVDTERAKVDSPYHSTIAHGYPTLSMLPYLWNQIIQVNNPKMMINYGMDKMKFGRCIVVTEHPSGDYFALAD